MHFIAHKGQPAASCKSQVMGTAIREAEFA